MSGSSEVVVVTGATSGVGRATVRKFAERGAMVGLLARGSEGLEGAAKDVESLGGTALALPCDVADPEQVEGAAASVEETFGPIDVWVNNAMTTVFAEVVDIPPAEFRRVMDVKYLGTEKVGGIDAAKLDLVPKSQSIRNTFQHIVLWIDPARGVSVQQQLAEPSGDYRLAKYSDIELNQKIPDTVFKLKTTSKTKTLSPQG